MTVHLRATLVGDGSQLEETRTSGYGDRDYGKPGAISTGRFERARRWLRALHPVVLHMRVGGQRRVRTCVLDDNWGYRETTYRSSRCRASWASAPRIAHPSRRKVQGDWLMDVVIELEKVEKQRPPTWSRRGSRRRGRR